MPPFRKPGSLEYFITGPGPDGQPQEIGLGTANLKEAIEVSRELGGAAPDSDPAGTAGATQPGEILPFSVHHALAYFLQKGSADLADATRRMYEQKAGQIVKKLGQVSLGDLTRADLDTYVAHRRAEGVKLETVRKELVVLRSALSLLYDMGEIETNIKRLLPKLRVKYVPRKRWLTIAEATALVGQMETHRQLWVLVILYTGARYSEAERLTWDAVDLTHNLIHLRGAKNSLADRHVPLHPELRDVLGTTTKSKGRILRRWVSSRRDLKAACKRAGIAPACFLDLRRTFCSWMKQEGVESLAAARLMGHRTSQMVDMVYGHLSNETSVRAVATLPKI